jgi:diguanylate cyclase (GGDEF)-like protein
MTAKPLGGPAPRTRDSRLRRHNRALMELGQQHWQAGEGLSGALSLITQITADAMGAGRVSIWRVENESLLCIQAFDRGERTSKTNCEAIANGHQDLLANTSIGKIRIIGGAQGEDWGPRLAYSNRFNVSSMIEAPIYSEKLFYGFICIESCEPSRQWQTDEFAFAGNMGIFVALAIEVSRRKEAELKLDYLKLNDPVSGLGNRALIHGAMEHILGRARNRKHPAALLFVGIDRFSTVNINAGEEGGDATLAAIGDLINTATPDGAVIARVDGDCFAVLIPWIEKESQAGHLATKILGEISNLAASGTAQFDIGGSVGIAFIQARTTTTAEEWLGNADFASKQAKSHGRNRFEVFDAEQHRGLIDQMLLEREIEEAFKSGAMTVAYQPEVDTKKGVMIAAEALLRWRLEDGTLRAAGEFIDVAESSGLIVPIGWWVLQKACEEAVGWRPTLDGRAPTLRVNLSARQFEQQDLVKRVDDILRKTGLEPERLCLELTETTLMTGAKGALETLFELRALGVGLAMDDFGTGYSSLSYLQRFPVNTLKIDRSFVVGLPGSNFDRAIVSAIIVLGEALGIEVMAEGVETIGQRDCLQSLGLTRMQGWLYAKALEPDNLKEFLEEYR